VRLEVTEAVLNHISGSRGGIAGVYQRHDWAAEKRAGLDDRGPTVARPSNTAVTCVRSASLTQIHKMLAIRPVLVEGGLAQCVGFGACGAHMWFNLLAARGDEDAQKARHHRAGNHHHTDRKGAKDGTGMEAYPRALIRLRRIGEQFQKSEQQGGASRRKVLDEAESTDSRRTREREDRRSKGFFRRLFGG